MFTFFDEGIRYDIPISQIRRIYWKTRTPELEDAAGNVYILDPEDIYRLERLVDRELLPETSGAKFLEFFDCEGEEFVRRLSILGWFVLGNGKVRPVTQNFDSMQSEDYAVLYADGHVESADGEFWPSEKDWLSSRCVDCSRVRTNEG